MMRTLYPRSKCSICGMPIGCDAAQPEAWPHWHYLWAITRRGVENFQFEAVCELCARMDIALDEAREESRRFTEIDIGERCQCGRAVHVSLSSCVLCWRERRMLDRQLRDVRVTARIAKQLKRRAMELAA